MGKNGSRTISIGQYRLTDLFLFAVILVLGELFPHFAIEWFPTEATYTISFTLAISLIVLMRWGWPSVVYSVIGGLFYCILNGATGRQYAIYCIGNAFFGIVLIPVYILGKEKVSSHWWSAALLAIGAWLCMYLGRSTVFAIAYAISPVEGATAVSGFAQYAVADLFTLVMAVLVVLVMRRFDGMFEDQKAYLTRLKEAGDEEQRRKTEGDFLAELNEQSLEELYRSDGGE